MSKIDVTSPFDGKVVGSVHFNTYEEVEAAIDLAHKTFLDKDNWIPKYKRIEILENVMKIQKQLLKKINLKIKKKMIL
jgi:acyl-CoA reductase-like NAD-dependent aldehyde dehydrogenase